MGYSQAGMIFLSPTVDRNESERAFAFCFKSLRPPCYERSPLRVAIRDNEEL